MVDVEGGEFTRMLLKSRALDLDPVFGHVLAFLAHDRLDIKGRAAGNRDEQKFQRRRSGASIAFGIHQLNTAAGRGSDKVVITSVSHAAFVSILRHMSFGC